MVDAPTLEMFFKTSSLYRDYSTLVHGDDSSMILSARLNTIVESQDNSKDFVSSVSSTPSSHGNLNGLSSNSSHNQLKVHLLASSSFDMSSQLEMELPEEQGGGIGDRLAAAFTGLRNTDYRIVRLHSEVILSRSIFALFRRGKLVMGSLVLHIFFAINFWWIMDDSSEDTNPVIGFFAVSGLVLIVANVQFGYYLFSNNEVLL